MENLKLFPVIDFSDWEKLNLPVTGIRKKQWLKNTTTGEVGLFKFPKTEHTGDYWAEKLAYELGKLLGIEVARTELGLCNGRIGSLSYNILNDGEHLLEGYSIIGETLDFSTSSEIYDNIGVNYSVELIEDVLGEQFNFILDLLVFDCLIGNTDRHHGNWAVITDDNDKWLKLSPLYDNGSSLCYLEKIERIELMQKDTRMLEAALYTKSKSQIGLGNIRPANHFDLFFYVCSKYNKDITSIVDKIESEVTEQSVSKLLEQFDNNIIDAKIKEFIKLFITKRRDKMIDIFNKCGRMEEF